MVNLRHACLLCNAKSRYTQTQATLPRVSRRTLLVARYCRTGLLDRTLVATTDHPAGALLISVPQHLQVRYDNVQQAAAAAAALDTNQAECQGHPQFGIPPSDAAALVSLFDAMPRGSDSGQPAWQFRQALTLLYHVSRGADSPLAPYLAHLPGLAPGVPTPRVGMLMADDAVQVDTLQRRAGVGKESLGTVL